MTSTGLADFDELVLTCRTERAKSYIQEALIAYRGGAYRAAIVSTWIAVVFDLIDKFRDLALSGDAQAKQIVGDFDKHLAQLDAGNQQAIGKALEFEREILDTARDKFLLFDQQQFTDLGRLRDDRNRCAHPTFQREGATYQPSAELARTHIRHAIEHVLRQPPVQGKAAIESVIGEVASEFFPTKADDIRTRLAEGPLGKPTPALVNGVVDRLLFDLFTKGSSLYKKASAIDALRATIELHRALAEPRVNSQVKKLGGNVPDEDLLLLCILAARTPEVWAGLVDGQRTRLQLYLKNGAIVQVAPLMRYALKADYLAEAVRDRLAPMSAADLAVAVAGQVGAEGAPRAVELFSTASNWAEANMIADRIILPLLEHLSADDVRSIIRSPRERGSDLRHAGGLSRFVDAVKQHKLIPTNELNDLLVAEDFKYLAEEEPVEAAEGTEEQPEIGDS